MRLTKALDMSRVMLSDLQRLDIREDVAAVVRQVQRPRVNLGGGGPPGRAD
jgi:hypothetical protein